MYFNCLLHTVIIAKQNYVVNLVWIAISTVAIDKVLTFMLMFNILILSQVCSKVYVQTGIYRGYLKKQGFRNSHNISSQHEVSVGCYELHKHHKQIQCSSSGASQSTAKLRMHRHFYIFKTWTDLCLSSVHWEKF